LAKIATLKLMPQERDQLQQIIKRGTDWRQRERARTLMLFDDNLCMREISQVVGINIRTVGLTRMDWIKRGFDSLVDRPRTGAPRKITPEELGKIIDVAKVAPLTAKALLAKHVEGGGTLVHVSTMTKALKSEQFVWKRTRTSLKKNEMKQHSEQLK